MGAGDLDDPDAPEPRDRVTPLEVAGGVVGLVAIVVADAATGGLISLLDAIPAPAPRNEPFPADLPPPAGTAAPVADGRGNVRCTGCGEVVPWASMTLDPDGYFCARCAAAESADGCRGHSSKAIQSPR
ncbi:MAG: hypothetical protein ACTHU0_08790 [Kofleriaceae bacterium]